MQLADKTAIALGGLGLGAGAVYMAASKFIPDQFMPLFGWGGLAMMVVCAVYLSYLHLNWRGRMGPTLIMIIGGLLFIFWGSDLVWDQLPRGEIATLDDREYEPRILRTAMALAKRSQSPTGSHDTR